MLSLCYSQLDGHPDTNHYTDTSCKLKKRKSEIDQWPETTTPEENSEQVWRKEAKQLSISCYIHSPLWWQKACLSRCCRCQQGRPQQSGCLMKTPPAPALHLLILQSHPGPLPLAPPTPPHPPLAPPPGPHLQLGEHWVEAHASLVLEHCPPGRTSGTSPAVKGIKEFSHLATSWIPMSRQQRRITTVTLWLSCVVDRMLESEIQITHSNFSQQLQTKVTKLQVK